MSLDLSQVQSDAINLREKAKDSRKRAETKSTEANRYRQMNDESHAATAQAAADHELNDADRYEREAESMDTDAQNLQSQIDSLNQQADDLENQAKAKRDEAAKLSGSGSTGFSLF